jgi:hypothetical protein
MHGAAVVNCNAMHGGVAKRVSFFKKKSVSMLNFVLKKCFGEGTTAKRIIIDYTFGQLDPLP